ncbi:HAD hydrolase-like protein [Henriciella marina]|uniref:HAD hydrolase-like protein n=1 Tax=Henriciella marina TaxID=453851 RepID=UPI00036E0FC5|nr:HAD hydrolase-like protein [Henriciella marina]
MTSDTLSGWTVVFDLDGTLVDTAPDLHLALNHCLEDAGFKPVPFDSIRHMIGQGAKAMIEKGLAYQGVGADEADGEALWQVFLSYYEANICARSKPFEGAIATLDGLTERGATLSVCTNKTQYLAETLLDALGLTTKFASICGADAVPEKKPSGDHILQSIKRAGGDDRRAIMIGDSQTDEKAARNAGLPFVFVTFGYGPYPENTEETAFEVSTYDGVMDAILSLVEA